MSIATCYERVLRIFVVELVLIFVVLLLTIAAPSRDWIQWALGDRFLLLAQVGMWGAFGALMASAYLLAKDKHKNYELECAGKTPNYPDNVDILMYGVYFATGILMGILSGFLVDIAADYLSPANFDPATAEAKRPLFALVAFYAGYSQFGLIKKIKAALDR